jgi:hypothetical protein
MKKLALLAVSALLLASLSAQAQQVRVRGTIQSLDGDVLSVKTREGKDMKISLTPDATVGTAKAMQLSDIKEGTLVGVTSVKGNDGKMVAKEVHIIPPTAPQGHMNWDLLPNSMMTNGNLSAPAKTSGGNEITVKYKDGEQKILVTSETAIVGFDNGSRADLKPGETIFSTVRVEGDGKFVTPRVAVSKNGVKPPQ